MVYASEHYVHCYNKIESWFVMCKIMQNITTSTLATAYCCGAGAQE